MKKKTDKVTLEDIRKMAELLDAQPVPKERNAIMFTDSGQMALIDLSNNTKEEIEEFLKNN